MLDHHYKLRHQCFILYVILSAVVICALACLARSLFRSIVARFRSSSSIVSAAVSWVSSSVRFASRRRCVLCFDLAVAAAIAALWSAVELESFTRDPPPAPSSAVRSSFDYFLR